MVFEKDLTREILDSIAEGLFTVDKNFKINYFNRAAERITGHRREETHGRFCKHIFRSKQCFIQCPIAKVLETGENIYDYETKIVHKNGSRIPIKLNVAVLRNDENEPIGGVISFRDISDLEIMRSKLSKLSQFHGAVGHSKPMQEIFHLIEEIADSDATVLIQGASGTGKEIIANAIQQTSRRRNEAYIKVNCSVFSPQLLASELFGHVKGAFTGSIRDRAGRFELAHKGTIFLDEVAEMPLQMQLQLLRVLQEGTFERVGESITRQVDVRVIAATNKDLRQAMNAGHFREDLFYRLNVIPIKIPSLHERPEDIPYLVTHFIEKFALVYKKDIHEIEDPSLDLLIRYAWPGNIRELENAIEYAFARTNETKQITAAKLPSEIRESVSVARLNHESPVNNSEALKIMKLLEKHQWNRSRVAQELGMGRSTLWRKLKSLKLQQQ